MYAYGSYLKIKRTHPDDMKRLNNLIVIQFSNILSIYINTFFMPQSLSAGKLSVAAVKLSDKRRRSAAAGVQHSHNIRIL